MKKYLLNCFLLTLPVMLWNILLTDKLPAVYQPDVFWHNIPDWIVYGENISRGLVFLIAFLMPLPTRKLHQKTGFWLYLTGLALYFASWILLIEHPDTQWSKSLWGFAAPAYTPILWLMGIALLGERWTRYYIIISVLFVVFHCWHCWVVWGRG
ncbi:hypothetical protein [Emticicia soli]|uniref:Uncharacterized protein n=1 Tax=Emticicia soli TaxID=2027878 RepID=A0ABW5JB80_9BACT